MRDQSEGQEGTEYPPTVGEPVEHSGFTQTEVAQEALARAEAALARYRIMVDTLAQQIAVAEKACHRMKEELTRMNEAME